jgi:hypothetical protein
MNYQLHFISDGNLAVKWFEFLQDAINWGKEWTTDFHINSPYIPGDICRYHIEQGIEYTESYKNWYMENQIALQKASE